MNKANLKKLMVTVKKSPFNWASMDMCLGFYAAKISGNYRRSKIEALQDFLEVGYEEAQNLYCGNSLDGVSFFSTTEWFKAGMTYEPARGHKKKALDYLQELYDKES